MNERPETLREASDDMGPTRRDILRACAAAWDDDIARWKNDAKALEAALARIRVLEQETNDAAEWIHVYKARIEELET